MTPKADESLLVYGAGVILKHMKALQEEVAGVQQAEDIEYVHRMRVASRRLRTALDLFSACLPRKKISIWQDQIKEVTHALGAARDTDVQIELVKKYYKNSPDPRDKPGIGRLLLRLKQKRDKIQADVVDALQVLEDDQTLDEIEQRLLPKAGRAGQVYLFSPSLYEHSFNAISARLNEFLGYDSYVNCPECVTELHAMRISAKHLRYTVEAFGPIYRDEMKETLQILRNIQDELGEIHDSDVWGELLPKFIEKERKRTIKYYGDTRQMPRLLPGLHFFQQDRLEYRQHHYLAFTGLWEKLKAEETWRKLQETIQLPVDLEQAREMLTAEGANSQS